MYDKRLIKIEKKQIKSKYYETYLNENLQTLYKN